MGIFSRIGEIVNANISSMLDQAEDPEKMVRLMINEMEDTLTEVKSSAAEVIAERIRTDRSVGRMEKSRQEWEQRAALAVEKNRDDLAREAIERKLMYERQAEEARHKLAEADELVKQYQSDIARLEQQLKSAYRRQKELASSMKRAQARKKVEEGLYRLNTSGVFERFEEYNSRLDRMEADLEVQSYGAPETLEQRFRELEKSGDVEAELNKLKNQGKK